MELIKRTEHFIQKPPYFGLQCSKCNGTNIAWSEYESHIWCYDCEQDIELFPKYEVFPVNAARLIGFDLRKWDMVNKCVIPAP